MTNEIYNGAYAEKYLDTIQNPYTQLKIATLARRIAATSSGDASRPHVVLDIGGNIHSTVTNGLRGALEKKGPSFRHVALDLDEAYFSPQFLQDKDSSVQVFPKAHGIVGDAKKMPLGDSTVDTIVLADVLEHIHEPEEVLKEAQRALRPDGIFLMVSPSLYKMDVFKNTRGDIAATVNGKRPSSHVNFFDDGLLRGLLEESDFDVSKTEGLSYATGFPYLLWQQAAYVTGAEPTPESENFKKVTKMFNKLEPDIHAAIDTEMNKPEIGERFVTTFINDPSVHPLDMVYEILRIHPEFSTRADLKATYETVKPIIDQQKENFDPDHLRELVTKFLQDNPYAYLANSVLVEARKQVKLDSE